MALRSPVPFHNFWGTTNPTTAGPWVSGFLPNEGVGPNYQSVNLEAGDFAYVAGPLPDQGTFYVCTNPGAGGFNAVWIALSTGGGASEDRFAPKYLVGGPNDTAAALPGTGGFWFVPDTGDGAGIELALSYANPSSPNYVAVGDVYIRPGTFDLTGVTLPLVVPSGVRLMGAGSAAGGTRIQYAVPSSSAGTAFQLSDGAELRDIAIVAEDNSNATGFGVVEVGQPQESATVHCERVSVELRRITTSTSSLRSAFFCLPSSSLTQDRCDVVLDGTGRTEEPVVPPPINPVAPPTPTGTTYTVGTLGAENFTDLATALASGSVVNGDRLLLSAQTFTSGAITVSKSVTIQGAGIGATVLQTAGTAGDPTFFITVAVSNVTIRDLTVKQRKTAADSNASAIYISPPGGGAGAFGHFIEAVRVETMEFGVRLTSDGWQINNCQFAYTGTTALLPGNDRKFVGIYRSDGQGIFTNSTYDTAQSTATGNTQIVRITSSVGLPTEVIGGYLRIGNITPATADPVFQFFLTDSFAAGASPLTLYVDNNQTNETSAFVVWVISQPNLLSRFQSITFANNTLSGNHGGAPVGCKGMFAVDSSGAPAQPWGTTTFYASGNTIGNTTFRTGWQTIMSTAAPPGYGAAELALAGWDGTFFVSNPALEFPMALVPADPGNALTGWRVGGKALRLDVCFCTGGDASVLAGSVVVPGATPRVDIDQSIFEGFGQIGIGCQDCDLAVTGGTRIESQRDENPDLWGIICRQTVGQAPTPSTALINARITLPLASQATSIVGIDLEVNSGQITASRIEAAQGIVSGNATGRGVAIGFNSVISQAGQQISAQLVDEVAHNILTT